ncbi:hypothetical protein [Streptomyces paludis]|uniref:Uncharacterized protein n=1 Tax=Streptomyces paludis TaxID=2282738 RepID=A0A345HIK8_9ACTN|nr:hypothetical protein [Streptomyces paludis]AXG76532.1 hypothetical protein DVK44_01315 [Streptomyces paludis]
MRRTVMPKTLAEPGAPAAPRLPGRPRGSRGARRPALTLALTGLALSLSAAPAAADSSACTHHFSGPQICIRLEGQGARNAVTGIWTNPPGDLTTHEVSLYRGGRLVSTATATRSGKALAYTWPTGDTGTGTELCVKFRGSQRLACQTPR